MTEQELIREFISVKKEGRNTVIRVRLIEWEGQYIPATRLVDAASIQGEVSDEDIQQEVQKILRTRKYFQICSECGETNPVGWMDVEMGICQSCASQNHDVAY